MATPPRAGRLREAAWQCALQTRARHRWPRLPSGPTASRRRRAARSRTRTARQTRAGNRQATPARRDRDRHWASGQPTRTFGTGAWERFTASLRETLEQTRKPARCRLAGWLPDFSHNPHQRSAQQTRHLHEPGLPSTGLHGRPRVPGTGDFLPQFLPRTPFRSRPRSPDPLSYRRFSSTLRSRRIGLPKLTVRVRFPSSAPT
jgi:hypothetical protein